MVEVGVVHSLHDCEIPGKQMAVIVEVPDEHTSRLAKRLVGRRSGVRVVIAGETKVVRRRSRSETDPPRVIRIQVDVPRTSSELLELFQDGVWAALPVDEEAINSLLRTYVHEVRMGISPLLSGLSNDRSEVNAFLSTLSNWASERRGRAQSGSESPLSERETQILQWIAQGVTSREIADELGFQLQTVKNRVTTILTKSHARSRTHAVAIALRNGWIQES